MLNGVNLTDKILKKDNAVTMVAALDAHTLQNDPEAIGAGIVLADQNIGTPKVKRKQNIIDSGFSEFAHKLAEKPFRHPADA
jgi:hypothetical protein